MIKTRSLKSPSVKKSVFAFFQPKYAYYFFYVRPIGKIRKPLKAYLYRFIIRDFTEKRLWLNPNKITRESHEHHDAYPT
jgi:hypothetical protein